MYTGNRKKCLFFFPSRKIIVNILPYPKLWELLPDSLEMFLYYRGTLEIIIRRHVNIPLLSWDPGIITQMAWKYSYIIMGSRELFPQRSWSDYYKDIGLLRSYWCLVCSTPLTLQEFSDFLLTVYLNFPFLWPNTVGDLSVALADFCNGINPKSKIQGDYPFQLCFTVGRPLTLFSLSMFQCHVSSVARSLIGNKQCPFRNHVSKTAWSRMSSQVQ